MSWKLYRRTFLEFCWVGNAFVRVEDTPKKWRKRQDEAVFLGDYKTLEECLLAARDDFVKANREEARHNLDTMGTDGVMSADWVATEGDELKARHLIVDRHFGAWEGSGRWELKKLKAAGSACPVRVKTNGKHAKKETKRRSLKWLKQL